MTAFSEAAQRVASGSEPASEAAALVQELSVDEKLGCLDGDLPYWPGLMEMMSGGYNRRTWPAAVVDRLGVPGIHFADGPRGCVVGPSTVFPVSMARGAAFDPDLEREIGRAIGAELRANGATCTGAVCMNLLRHPAWGRAQETYGEDPHHVGEMALALTEGLQDHVMACMKHFALNSMENARFSVDVTVGERALHEIYLPHFRKVAEAGVASVMSAYNSVNGEWCGENRTLLIDILRDEWEWDGFVITDFIAGLRDPVKSVGAGQNIEMPFRQQRAMALAGGLADGTLSIDDVDARVTETIATLLRFAWVFDHSMDSSVVASTEHRALARRAAAESMVLLRNERTDGAPFLPVDPTALQRVAVLGRLSDVCNTGDNGSSNVRQPRVVTPLAGLQAALPEVALVHSVDDASLADDADLVVVVVGYDRHDEGEFISDGGSSDGDSGLAIGMPPMSHPELGLPEGFEAPSADNDARSATDTTDRPPGEFGEGGGDRLSLQLHAPDVQLIEEARSRSDQVVVVVEAGSAVVMPWLESIPATLLIWYPGMEGGHALADVLFGSAEPGGRLPFAIPTDEHQLVPFDRDATAVTYELLHGQWLLDANDRPPCRSFGFGLGYTSFDVSDVRLEGSAAEVAPTILAMVENTGDRAGSTVVQVYGSVPGSTHERPRQRLIGFDKVFLDAGQRAQVLILVEVSLLDLRSDGAWVTEPLDIELRVGLDAEQAAQASPIVVAPN